MRHQATSRRLRLCTQAGVTLACCLAPPPPPAAASTFREFAVPTGGGEPYGITSGPDGNLWFTESVGSRIGRITTSGVVTEFALPAGGGEPAGIVSGPDGNVWFAQSGRNLIGRITPSGTISEFVVPTLDSAPLGIAAGPDGNVWFTEVFGNKIGRITPQGVITEFSIPTTNSLPASIVAGPDGNLWFTEAGSEKIARITPAGVVTEFVSPAPLPLAPGCMALGGDGNIWIAASTSIVRITPAGVATTFSTAGGLPQALTADADGHLWFPDVVLPQVGRITTSGALQYFPTAAIALGIAHGPDGNLWLTETLDDQIGRLRPAPAKGDFDGDGQSELIFRNAIDGIRNKVWFMNGVVRASQEFIVPNAPSADWRIRGADDFDNAAAPGTGRDFVTDLVFWNQVTGGVEFWLMNGVNRVGSAVPLAGGVVLPPNWDLSATAEFSHDGRPDLVWRDFVTQQIVIWTMNGVTKTGEIVPNPSQAVDGNWIVVAAADYNDDGQTDFLWYNFTSGKIVTWYMDKDVVRTAGQFTTPDAALDANWKVVASADYSGAPGVGTPPVGSPDVVWRNETSGNQVVWHMDFASTRVTGEFTSPISNSPASNWTIVGPR